MRRIDVAERRYGHRSGLTLLAAVVGRLGEVGCGWGKGGLLVLDALELVGLCDFPGVEELAERVL